MWHIVLFAVWGYQTPNYTWIQIFGFLAYPMSIGSLVLGTISWHFHRKETVLETLTIMDRIKVAPFFILVILTKVWVLADTLNTLHWTAEHLQTGHCPLFEFEPIFFADESIFQVYFHYFGIFTMD